MGYRAPVGADLSRAASSVGTEEKTENEGKRWGLWWVW